MKCLDVLENSYTKIESNRNKKLNIRKNQIYTTKPKEIPKRERPQSNHAEHKQMETGTKKHKNTPSIKRKEGDVALKTMPPDDIQFERIQEKQPQPTVLIAENRELKRQLDKLKQKCESTKQDSEDYWQKLSYKRITSYINSNKQLRQEIANLNGKINKMEKVQQSKIINLEKKHERQIKYYMEQSKKHIDDLEKNYRDSGADMEIIQQKQEINQLKEK